ncbi:hypothetical protein [Spirulina sp. 06S082]|uniref:hypothetical protein n=1 Tax=Spirulina sp. 06S082 TaxID=3110248 RepID=UPI002B21DDD7|nr:hypothetical protein [Spirulina sp. 06S082]MEA5468034.1 hypothetical protein [Spirulina sp. 06S082]
MWGFFSLIAIVVYGAGIWKFWKGYQQTNFQPGLTNRVALSLLWPVLLITNKSYRQNFQKALKGR